MRAPELGGLPLRVASAVPARPPAASITPSPYSAANRVVTTAVEADECGEALQALPANAAPPLKRS